jgi:tetratricopeptide (TPR) repeat protein
MWQSALKGSAEPMPPNYGEIETWARACLSAAHRDGAGFHRMYQLTLPLAELHRRYGFYEQAATEYNQILKIVEKNPSAYTVPDRAAPQRLIADCYFFARMYDKALYWYQEAVKSSLYLLDDRSGYFVQIYANVGDIYYSQGKMRQALECYEKAVKLCKLNRSENNRLMPPRVRGKVAPPDDLVLLMNTADSLCCLSDYNRAKDSYESAMRGWLQWKKREADSSEAAIPAVKGQNLSSQAMATCEYNLGLANEKLGNASRARLYFEVGLRDLTKSLPADDPVLAQAIAGYSNFLRRHDFIRGYFEAMELERRVKESYH